MKNNSGLIMGLTLTLLAPALAVAKDSGKVRAILEARRYVNSSRSAGYLAVEASRVAINPVYTKFPFQVGSEDARTTNTPQGSVLYTDGQYGNLEINELPEPVQASLRLMQPLEQDIMPDDVQIKVSSLDAGTLRDQAQMLRNQLLVLDGRLNALNIEVRQIYDYHSSVGQLNNLVNILRTNENQIELLRIRRRRAQAAVAEASQEEFQAKRELEDARRATLWCTYNYVPLACRWKTADQAEALTEAQSRLSFLTVQETRLGAEINRLTQVVDQLRADAETLARHNQASGNLANSTAFRDREEVKQNRRSLMAALDHLSSFVRDDARSLKASAVLRQCQNPLHYQGWGDPDSPRHPFFADEVDPGFLLPEGYDIWVCPTADNRPASIHVVQGQDEIFYSVILRAANGQINEIQISDSQANVLEDHRWNQPKPELIDYGVRFRVRESAKDFVSIFTEISDPN